MQRLPRLAALLAAAAASPGAATAVSTALSFTAVGYVFVAVPLLDLVFGQDLRDPLDLPFKPKRHGGNQSVDRNSGKLVGGVAGGPSDWVYRVLVYMFIPVHYAVRPELRGAAARGVATSCGSSCGMHIKVRCNTWGPPA